MSDRFYSLIVITTIIAAILAGFAGGYIRQNRDNGNKTPVGILLNLTTQTGWLLDSSVLYLTDGSVINVYGSVSKWRKGMEVTHPAPDGSALDDYDEYWCLDDTCLEQK